MKLFVSWSKQTSHQVAVVLREWLPLVVTSVKPWVSSEDIAKGTLGSASIMEQLSGTGQGVVCVTRENLAEPWLHFEAGALASHTDPRVRTLLFDLEPRDVTGPLWDFQHTDINDREDMFKFVTSVNDVCAQPLDPRQISKLFENSWPDWINQIDEIRQRGTAGGKPERKDRELLVETLDRVRAMERHHYDLTTASRALGERLAAVAASVGVNDHPLTGQFAAFPDHGVGRIVTFGEQWVEVRFPRKSGHC